MMYKILIFTLLSFVNPIQSISPNKVEVYEHVVGLNKMTISGMVSRVKSYQTFDHSYYFIYIDHKIIKISDKAYNKGVIIGEKHSFTGLRKLAPKEYLKYNLFRK
ncbi:hypothetical protein GJU39_23035 [Pedobacter petrophilus]|uniref:Uncharacterized protein n=1 Tax=Pedobacter petrophilus TaxID=1908241 RepID=A0A7K0G5N0_9SPHI|nr:hypothetical protein [Pedobacter petrophilus]MRX78942.1 hypothetical protein [Pedobacter petrophilus]